MNQAHADGYRAYLIFVEGAGDFYFSPEGVLAVTSDGHYTVYCPDARHNFLRAAMLKFPLEALAGEGVSYRGAQFRIEDLTPFQERQKLTDASIADLLRAVHRENPVRHAFLRAYAIPGVR